MLTVRVRCGLRVAGYCSREGPWHPGESRDHKHTTWLHHGPPKTPESSWLGGKRHLKWTWKHRDDFDRWGQKEKEEQVGGGVHKQRPALPSPHVREEEKQERVKSKNRAPEVQEDRQGKVTGWCWGDKALSRDISGPQHHVLEARESKHNCTRKQPFCLACANPCGFRIRTEGWQLWEYPV